MEIPIRIHTAFEALTMTQQLQNGMFTNEGTNVIPPRSLTKQEAGLRSAALETITRFILGDLETEFDVVQQVQPPSFASLIKSTLRPGPAADGTPV